MYKGIRFTWARIFQERYLSATENKNKNNRPGESPCWWVPLSYTNSKEAKFTDAKPEKWLTCSGPMTFKTDATSDQWLLFNLKAAGKEGNINAGVFYTIWASNGRTFEMKAPLIWEGVGLWPFAKQFRVFLVGYV